MARAYLGRRSRDRRAAGPPADHRARRRLAVTAVGRLGPLGLARERRMGLRLPTSRRSGRADGARDRVPAEARAAAAAAGDAAGARRPAERGVSVAVLRR